MLPLSQDIYENESFYDGSEVYYLNSNKNRDFFSSNCDMNSMDNKYLDTEERFAKIFLQNSTDVTINPPKIKKLLFEVIYPNKIVNEEDMNYDADISFETSELVRDRAKKRKSRFENRDNIRKKIKRAFLNNFIRKKINNLLKRYGCTLNFEYFSQKFVSEVSKKGNADIIYMTLLEIIKNKELFSEKDYSYYTTNLKIVNSEETKEIKLFQEMLNKTFAELFEEYINSKEFKVDEIKRLKRKKMTKDYINRYVLLAKNFIKFYTE
jgi:hypothetical protein